MDNRLIDVAIGLVLLFAMTSLLVTAMQEAWSQMKGRRGEFLQKALVSFVGDDTRFAQTLMQHPLLVSLAPQTKAAPGKPSYMEASSLVPALLGHLIAETAAGARPASPQGLIALLQGAPAATVPPDFVKGLAALSQGVENDWQAFESRVAGWWDAVNVRAGGWFKRDVQVTVFVFGLLAAAAMNINPITVADRLWNDEALRAAMVSYARGEQGANAAAKPPQPPTPTQEKHPDPAALLGALSSALEQAIRNPPAGATTLPGSGLTKTLERVTNFKRSLLALGSGQRAQLLPSAKLLLDDLPRERLPAEVRLAHDRLMDALTPAPATAPAAAQPPAPAASGASAPDTQVGNNCKPAEDASLCAVRQRAEGVAELQKLGLPIGWTESAQPRYFQTKEKETVKDTDKDKQKEKDKRMDCPTDFTPGQLCWWGNRAVSLLGWIITGLACTLGAPFWFDTLGRLVRLRASGAKTEGSSPAPGTSPSTTAAPASTPPSTPGGTAMHDALSDPERELTEAQVRRLQSSGLLMADGDCTGWFDGKTRARIQAWQNQSRPGQGSGVLSAVEIDTLLGR